MTRRMKFILQPVLSGCCMLMYMCTINAQVLPSPLSLRTTVSLALQHYPSVEARQADVDAADALVTEAKNAWLPSVKFNEQIDAGTDNSLTSAYFPLGIVPSASGGRRAENNGRLSAGNMGTLFGQWEIYNFGGYAAHTNEAQASLQVSKNGLQVERYRIQSAVIQHYFNLLSAQLLTTVQLQNIRRTDTIRQAILAYVNSGLRASVDSSVAEAELSKARLTYLDLVNTLRQTKNQLSVLTGIDTSAIMADPSVNALLVPLLSGQPGDTLPAQHPILNYYNSIYLDNLAKQQVIKKNNLPKVHLLAAGWMRGSSISPADVYDKNILSGLGYSRFNYLAGISFTYDLFEIRRTKYRLNEQKYVSEAARADLKEQQTLISSSLSEADINIRTALQKLKEIPVQQGAAQAAFRQKFAMYNSGLTNIVDLTNALYLLNRAETDTILATGAAWKAILQRAYASNTVDQLLSTLK